MIIDSKVLLIFKDKDGNKKELTTTFKEMLFNDVDTFYERLDDDCTSSGCNNESQNFCDCGGGYEDYDISEVKIVK